jgi:hypothetical protein
MDTERGNLVKRLLAERRLEEITDPNDRLLVQRLICDELLPGVKSKVFGRGGFQVQHDYSLYDWKAVVGILRDKWARDDAVKDREESRIG